MQSTRTQNNSACTQNKNACAYIPRYNGKKNISNK